MRDIHDEIEELSLEIANQDSSLHSYDIAEKLTKLRSLDFDSYVSAIQKIPSTLFADILAEMPIYIQEEISEYVSTKKLVNVTSNMDSDDAATFIQNLSEEHEDVVQIILENLNVEEKEVLEQLISYENNEVGSYMQTELFSANIDDNIGDSIKKLKILKELGKVDNIWHCHIVDAQSKYLGSIGLEELIIVDHHLKFRDIDIEKFKTYSINHTQEIKEAVEMFSNYNLSSLPIIDNNLILIGRVTSDDIYDVMEENATEQIYNMAGVSEQKEQEESLYQIGKSRAIWLSLNLITAISASIVIGFFDATIQSLVALAILMPIVASMGGNAGTQTLTVTIRQMALGDIDSEDAKKTIYKEVIISLANGLLFAVIIGTISFLWFKIPMLGVVIAISMIINLLSAGFFGALIPLSLQKFGIDPAIGSTVLLTTVTDIVGFFSFLGLATVILL